MTKYQHGQENGNGEGSHGLTRLRQVIHHERRLIKGFRCGSLYVQTSTFQSIAIGVFQSLIKVAGSIPAQFSEF
jgi:hypothetical protein